MQKPIPFWGLISLIVLATIGPNRAVGQEKAQPRQNKPVPSELSEHDKQLLNLRIRQILERDQQFRKYLAYETTDDQEIARLEELDLNERLLAMPAVRGKLSENVRLLLHHQQRKNDQTNHQEFVAIVKQYGYPSPERLGIKSDDLFPLLLHPPVEPDQVEAHLKSMSSLLRPEVAAGRMKPKWFAMFVDNMLGKILRRPQLYGTNEVFNPETRSIDPPIIENLESTNKARREIGLPELKSGEYQLISPKKR